MSTVESPGVFVFADMVDAFAAFCGQLRTDDAANDYPPFVLEDWQRNIARSILVDRVMETLVLIPKGNGKTTLLGALALWHLLTTGTARCYIGAASRQQAGEMYLHAEGFVQRDAMYGDGELHALLKLQPGYKKIVRRDDGGYIEVRAADAATQDGVGPTLALVDEYHRHPSDALYSVFRDGLDKRNGQLATISTAGDDEESPLGRLRTNLRNHIVHREGRYTYAHNVEGGSVLHEWALHPEDDPDDLALVKLANPLSSITLAKLRRRRMSSSMTRGKWARLTCNLWGAGDEAAIARGEWMALGDPDAFIPEGEHIYLGLDLGWKWDTTALVPVWWDDDAQRFVVADPTVLVPPRDGTMMDEARVWKALRRYTERFRVTLVVDPNAGGQELVPAIERDLAADDGNGVVVVVEHPQAPTPMADASMRVVEAVRTGGLVHDGNADLTRQVLTAVADPIRGDDEERFMFGKPRRRTTARRKRGDEREFRCIDGLVAMSMAIRVAQTDEPEGDADPFVL